MTIQATGGRLKVAIDGLDFSSALDGTSVINATAPTTGSPGLILVSAEFTLAQTSTCPESLDPRENPGRWQIGLPVQVWIEDQQGTFVKLHTLRIRTRPVYDEYELTLALDCACTLSYLDTKTPANELTGIDPTEGKSRTDVVDLLLTNGAGTPPGTYISTLPGMLYWPPAKYGTDSFVSQAGEIAFSTPGGPHWLYCNPEGDVASVKYGDGITDLPWFVAYPGDIIDVRLLNGDEYTKPVRRVKCTGTQVTVTDQTFENKAVNEEFASLHSLIGGAQAPVGTRYDVPVLTYGEYVTQQIEGDTFYKKTTLKNAFVTPQFNTGANAGIKFIYSVKVIGIIEEFTVYNNTTDKDENGDYSVTAGYARSRIKIESKLETGDIERSGNTIRLTEGLDEWQRTRETWSYDADGRMNKYVKAVDNKLGGLFVNVVPPVGTDDDLIPPSMRSAAGEAWAPASEIEITWTKSGTGDFYDQTTKKRITSALKGAQSRYTLVNDGTTTDKVSAPNEPDIKPQGYTTSEKQIKAYSSFRAPGGFEVYDDLRTEGITFADDEDTLKRLANWIMQHDYGISQGRNFQLAATTSIINLIASRPFQCFHYQDPEGAIWSHLFAGYAIHSDTRETIIEFDAPLLGTVRGETPTVTGNTVTTGRTLVTYYNQPVVFYGTGLIAGVLVPGRVYYATPDGSGGFTLSEYPGGPTIALSVGGVLSGVTVGSPTVVTPPYQEVPTLIATHGWRGELGGSSTFTTSLEMVGTHGWTARLLSNAVSVRAIQGWSGLLGSGTAKRITGFSPPVGEAGTLITVIGNGFTGATGLTIGGVAATGFAVNAAGTQAMAVVGAGTISGVVAIVTPSGTLTSATAFIVPTTDTGNSFTWVMPIKTTDFAAVVNEGYYTNNDLIVDLPLAPVGSRIGLASLDLNPLRLSDGTIYLPATQHASYFNLSPNGWIPEFCCNNTSKWATIYPQENLFVYNVQSSAKNESIVQFPIIRFLSKPSFVASLSFQLVVKSPQALIVLN